MPIDTFQRSIMNLKALALLFVFSLVLTSTVGCLSTKEDITQWNLQPSDASKRLSINVYDLPDGAFEIQKKLNPPAGKRYVFYEVTITVKNMTEGSAITYKNFKLKDMEGKIYEPVKIDEVPSTDFFIYNPTPGMKFGYALAFEVPHPLKTNAQQFRALIYEDDYTKITTNLHD